MRRRHSRFAPTLTKGFTERAKSSDLSIAETGFAYLTLVNLANDGTVQLLYPLGPDEMDAKLDPAQPFSLTGVDVSGPYGADLLVAVATAEPNSTIVSEIARLDGQTTPLLVPATFEKWLAGTRYRIGLFSFYTCDGAAAPC